DGIRVFHVTGVQTCALPISCCLSLRLRSTSIVSRTAGRTHVTYSCSGMERLVPSSWSSPAPEIFVHFSPGAARHSRSAGGRHGFTAAQANGSHPELYKLHCSKLSRGGRPAGRPDPGDKPTRQLTNDTVASQVSAN